MKKSILLMALILVLGLSFTSALAQEAPPAAPQEAVKAAPQAVAGSEPAACDSEQLRAAIFTAAVPAKGSGPQGEALAFGNATTPKPQLKADCSGLSGCLLQRCECRNLCAPCFGSYNCSTGACNCLCQ